MTKNLSTNFPQKFKRKFLLFNSCCAQEQFFSRRLFQLPEEKRMMLKVTAWLKVFQQQYYNDVIMQISSCTLQEFTGNSDRNTVQKNNVESLPRTKFIRFRPTEKQNWPTLRVEIYGAAQGSSYFYILSVCVGCQFLLNHIEGIGMDGQLTIFVISCRFATNPLVFHPGTVPDGVAVILLLFLFIV